MERFKLNKKGFTLAETLITLGIIGIVAAMTVPALVQNYRKKQWVTGLKAGITILDQGFKKVMADAGVDDFRNTDLFVACNDDVYYDAIDKGMDEDEATNIYIEGQKVCFSILQKYFKGLKLMSWGYMLENLSELDEEGWTITNPELCKKGLGEFTAWSLYNEGKSCIITFLNAAYTLINGMRFGYIVNNQGDPYTSESGTIHNIDPGIIYISLDINGNRGPNTYGRDVFMLVVLKDGSVVPYQGYKYYQEETKICKAHDSRCRWGNLGDNVEARTKNAERNTCASPKEYEIGSYNGFNCASRIERDGWEMKY